ncbi:MAG: hypothetical protein ACRDLM_07275 [Gaiellaceae bacterium]
MRRVLLSLGLAAALAVLIAAPSGSATGSIPRGFRPEAAAAFGTRDIWLLGGTTLLRSTDAGRHFTRSWRRRRLGRVPERDDGGAPAFDEQRTLVLHRVVS